MESCKSNDLNISSQHSKIEISTENSNNETPKHNLKADMLNQDSKTESLNSKIKIQSNEHYSKNKSDVININSNFIPNSHILISKLTFMLIGLASVLNWTIVLNCILPIFDTIYNFPRGADTVLIGYFFFSLLMSFYRFYFRNLKAYLPFLGLVVLYICTISIPFIINFVEGSVGIGLLHFVLAFIGLGVSLVLSNGMAYASMIPINMTGFVMAGQGLAGLFGFLLWQFLTQLFFNIYDKDQIRIAAFIAFFLCLVPLIILNILYLKLINRSWFKISLNEFTRTSFIKLNPELGKKFIRNDHKSMKIIQTGLIGTRPTIYVFKDIFLSMILGLGTLFLTFSLFPNIGPYDFNGRTISEKTIFVGIFQTIDFIGRLLPNLNQKFLLPYNFLVILVPLRLLFYPLFILSVEQNNAFFSSFLYQFIIIILFASTNGYISSQAISDIPRRSLTTAERGLAGLIFSIAIQLGLLMGISISQLIKYLYNNF